MFRDDDGVRSARAMMVGAAVALMALAGCNRNEPPMPRSDAPPANTAPGSAGSSSPGAASGAGTTGSDAMRSGAATAVGDTAVTAKVKTALLADPLVKGLAIEVETSDGVVSLKGRVSGAAERAKAIEIARNVDGVRSVTDVLSTN